MLKQQIQALADKFKKFSEQAMKDSEAENNKRNWVKGERKETEAETWMEAHRMTNKLLLAPEKPKRSVKFKPVKHFPDGGYPPLIA